MNRLKLLKDIFGNTADENEIKQYLPYVAVAIKTLNEREQLVLKKRYSGKTLRETAKHVKNKTTGKNGVSPAMARVIEIRALRKLRHPSCIAILKNKEVESQEWTDMFLFSTRTRHCLENEGITSINDLLNMTDIDLLKIKNFGRKSLNEIKKVLAERGLSTKPWELNMKKDDSTKNNLNISIDRPYDPVDRIVLNGTEFIVKKKTYQKITLSCEPGKYPSLDIEYLCRGPENPE